MILFICVFIVVYIYREEDILFCFCDNIFQWWLASLSLFDIISVYLFFGELFMCLSLPSLLLLFVDDQFSVFSYTIYLIRGARRLVPISVEVGNYPPISPTQHSLCVLCALCTTARLPGLHTAFL